MIHLDSIQINFWHSNNLSYFNGTDTGTRPPNLWLFYNCNLPAPSLVSRSDQELTIQANKEGVSYNISFIYASTSYITRRNLWSTLQNFQFSEPLLILDDFNAVLGAHEKLGGNLPSNISCKDFASMIDNLGLFHMDFMG